jgi:hypothetical protein
VADIVQDDEVLRLRENQPAGVHHRDAPGACGRLDRAPARWLTGGLRAATGRSAREPLVDPGRLHEYEPLGFPLSHGERASARSRQRSS